MQEISNSHNVYIGAIDDLYQKNACVVLDYMQEMH